MIVTTNINSTSENAVASLDPRLREMEITNARTEVARVVWFDIATAFGDTVFRFVQHQGPTPLMPDLTRLDPVKGGFNRYGIKEVDHVTTNFLTMQPALAWMEQVMGLERYWDVEFHTADVAPSSRLLKPISLPES